MISLYLDNFGNLHNNNLSYQGHLSSIYLLPNFGQSKIRGEHMKYTIKGQHCNKTSYSYCTYSKCKNSKIHWWFINNCERTFLFKAGCEAPIKKLLSKIPFNIFCRSYIAIFGRFVYEYPLGDLWKEIFWSTWGVCFTNPRL